MPRGWPKSTVEPARNYCSSNRLKRNLSAPTDLTFRRQLVVRVFVKSAGDWNRMMTSKTRLALAWLFPYKENFETKDWSSLSNLETDMDW